MAYIVDSGATGGAAITNSRVIVPVHQVDDLLVMFTVLNAGSVTINSTGWSTVSNNSTGGTGNTSSWAWKRATTNAETLFLTTTDDYSCIVLSIRDADVAAGTAVINASSHLGSATSTSTPSSVAVTTTETDCLVVYFMGVSGVAVASHANPGVHHAISFDNGSATDATATCNAAAWTIKRATGSTLAPSWTCSLAGTSARATIAIKNKVGGRVPAYIDSVAGSPATTITPAHHYSTLNNISFPTTLTSSAAIKSKTVTYLAGAAQADLGIVPLSSGIGPAVTTIANTALRGYDITLTGTRNLSTGLLVGSIIGSTPKQGAFGAGAIADGGYVIRIGSSATNWEAYQVASRDSVPNLVNRVVWAIKPGYTGTVYGTPGTATALASVSYIQFLYNSPYFPTQIILSEVYQAFTQIIAGGTTAAPVDTEGVAEAGRSFRLPVIQQTGAFGLLSYVPIQIGGGDAVIFDIDAGSLQFPRRYSPTKKEIAFHAPDNSVGISYAGKSGDTIKHTNSVITSPNTFYWEINSAATSAATWSFSGLTIVNANVTLRNVMTFDNMTFSQCPTVVTTGCTVTNAAFADTIANSLTVSSTTSITTSTFDTRTIAAGSGLVTLTTTTGVPISNSTFTGSTTTGHAIIITVPGTYSFSGLTFTGYNGTPGDNATPNSGSTSAAVYNNSGGAVIIQVTGGSQPSVRNGAGATTDVQASADVTITGLIAGSEVRAYTGSINSPLSAVEIGGVESSGTSFTFTQSSSGVAGYIQIFNVSYQPIIIELTYSGSNESIPVQQSTDRQYDNPA